MLTRRLYFGDNLDILKDKIPDNFVDLIYLDPPFQSGRNYNIIFQPKVSEVIKGANAEIKTFGDTWEWGMEAEKNYEGLITGTITKEKPNQKLIDLMKAMRSYLGECPMMAYLSMMAPRLLEMRRVLKNTGSIYLHCDPTASHYLKLLMDAIFGVENFRNEIAWCYAGGAIPKKDFPRKHDIILRYTKTDDYLFNVQYRPYGEWTKRFEPRHSLTSGGGKLREEGTPVNDWWSDFTKLTSYQVEWIGYPTQKPEKLLERIIKASSNRGDLVLDPFCGCGTTLAVAEKLGRQWIGIDITYLAIDVISKRLEESKIKEGVDFEIDGQPTDVYSAKKLAGKNPFQFQLWCISKLNATPSQTKSADMGVDGFINFFDLTKSSKVGKATIQVKGTENVNPSMVRDLKGTIRSQNADFGILITFKAPTRGMVSEASKEGYFKSEYIRGEIPKIQFLTVDDLFKEPIPINLPQTILPPYKKPMIEKELEEERQDDLFKHNSFNHGKKS